ncbi:MAG: hypothetical protein ACD_15C00018G0002 [uncultured bacterium]|nr:MAG: hypothetical protein ACD_15C00018G0002 [uncultured bacterium]
MALLGAFLVIPFAVILFSGKVKAKGIESIRKIKNLVYYEATVHNPEGNLVPDGTDDYILGKIKDLLR